jgi:hypothetical protein
MAEAFIKLYKKMLNWEWYQDTNTKAVFLHCLLMANWKDGRFMGEEIPRGSFASSYPHIAKQTNLSVQKVRTAISHLISTKELTVKATPKFSVFTVVKWDEYQGANMVSNVLPTGNQQASNRQSTTIEEYKEIKNNKNIYNSAPKPSAADKVGGNTRKYSHEFFEELERINEAQFR